MKKHCGMILFLMVFAAACGEHAKDKPEKYVMFEMNMSGESPTIAGDTVINSLDLIAFGHPYQRPLKDGHAKFFANVKERKRTFQLDFAHRATEESLLTAIINDWTPMPALQVNGCQLGYADIVSVTTAEDEIEYRLEALVDQADVQGKDCTNKLTQSIAFALSLVNGQIAGTGGASCRVMKFPNPFSTVLGDFGGQLRGAAMNKPWDTDLLCNATLPDGTLLVTSSGTSQYGYQFFIQNYLASDFDIDHEGSFYGYRVHIDEEGNVTNIKPHTPPVPPAIGSTSVTVSVRGYGVLQNPLDAYCDFNGTWTPVPMAMSYAAGSTIVVSQTVVFANVTTGRQYACNFKDTVTGQWIYFPPPSTASANYVFMANGVQVVEPAGNDLRISLDGTGQMIVTRHSMTFTAIPAPGMVITPDVRLVLGNTGLYTTYPMSLVNGQWVATVSLPWGMYEANVVSSGGAYYWLTDQGEAGLFYVADATANMTLPGVRLDPYQDAIMYATQVTGPPPGYFIGHRKNYAFRVDVTGINGQDYLTTIVGITF